MNSKIMLFILLTAALRFFLAMLFPITADESYYWLWSKHLSLSYVDHPPMVALINYLTTFGRENLIGLRLGVVIISTLVSILIYYLANELFGKKVAFFSIVLFQLIPHFLIIWLTMFVELPLVLFWTASLLILAHIIKTQNNTSPHQKFWCGDKLWYLLAVMIGLGYLSKYTMFIFWPCLLLFFFLSPENRFWLKRKEPYLTFLLSLLFFSPVMIWNSQHQWVSFAYHSGKLSGEVLGKNLLLFLVDQLVHFTPFLIFASYGIAKYSLKRTETKLLLSFSLPVIIFFLLASIKIKVWAHWPSVAYIGLIPLALVYLMENNKSWQKFLNWNIIFALLILSILFWISPGVMLHQKDYRLNNNLAGYFPPDQKLFSQTNVSSSLLEFYLKRPVYLSTGFLKIGYPWGQKQYEIWGIPKLSSGENIIYYGEGSDSFHQKAAQHFKEIIPLPQPRLYLIEDYISNNYRFYRLEGFKGGDEHP
jgi:4-amino-4-deoxy-L-arabinose transferase-like glycosyltransferase